MLYDHIMWVKQHSTSHVGNGLDTTYNSLAKLTGLHVIMDFIWKKNMDFMDFITINTAFLW